MNGDKHFVYWVKRGVFYFRMGCTTGSMPMNMGTRETILAFFKDTYNFDSSEEI